MLKIAVLTLFVFYCAAQSQNANNYNYNYLSRVDATGQQQPVPSIKIGNHNFYPRTVKVKPCARRMHKNHPQEQLVPTYTSVVIQPLPVPNENEVIDVNNNLNNLQPEALKEGSQTEISDRTSNKDPNDKDQHQESQSPKTSNVETEVATDTSHHQESESSDHSSQANEKDPQSNLNQHQDQSSHASHEHSSKQNSEEPKNSYEEKLLAAHRYYSRRIDEDVVPDQANNDEKHESKQQSDENLGNQPQPESELENNNQADATADNNDANNERNQPHDHDISKAVPKDQNEANKDTEQPEKYHEKSNHPERSSEEIGGSSIEEELRSLSNLYQQHYDEEKDESVNKQPTAESTQHQADENVKLSPKQDSKQEQNDSDNSSKQNQKELDQNNDKGNEQLKSKSAAEQENEQKPSSHVSHDDVSASQQQETSSDTQADKSREHSDVTHKDVIPASEENVSKNEQSKLSHESKEAAQEDNHDKEAVETPHTISLEIASSSDTQADKSREHSDVTNKNVLSASEEHVSQNEQLKLSHESKETAQKNNRNEEESKSSSIEKHPPKQQSNEDLVSYNYVPEQQIDNDATESPSEFDQAKEDYNDEVDQNDRSSNVHESNKDENQDNDTSAKEKQIGSPNEESHDSNDLNENVQPASAQQDHHDEPEYQSKHIDEDEHNDEDKNDKDSKSAAQSQTADLESELNSQSQENESDTSDCFEESEEKTIPREPSSEHHEQNEENEENDTEGSDASQSTKVRISSEYKSDITIVSDKCKSKDSSSQRNKNNDSQSKEESQVKEDDNKHYRRMFGDEPDRKSPDEKPSSDTKNKVSEADENQNSRKAFEKPQNDGNYDPRNAAGVSDLSQSPVMLLKHTRICYACSSASNPSCWAPDRTTTIKYCHKGHGACIKKVFGTGNSAFVIRDCAKSCEDTSVPGLEPKYKSCSVCHSDFCNGAFAVNSHSLMFILFLVTFIKYLI